MAGPWCPRDDPVDVRGRWQACGVPVMCLRPQGPALALALAFSPPEKGAPRKRGTVLSSSGSSLSGSLKSHGPVPGQRAGRCHTLHGGLPKLLGPLGLALGTAGWPSLTYRLHRFSSSCTRRHLPGCHDGCNYFCLQILSAQGKARQAWPGKLRIVSHGGRDAAVCPPRRPPAPACSRSCASVGTPCRDDGCHRLESASLEGRGHRGSRSRPALGGTSQAAFGAQISSHPLRKPDSAAGATNSASGSAGNSGIAASGRGRNTSEDPPSPRRGLRQPLLPSGCFSPEVQRHGSLTRLVLEDKGPGPSWVRGRHLPPGRGEADLPVAFVARWRPDLPLLCPCFDTVALCHLGDLGARESVFARLFHRPPARCRRPSAAPEAVLAAPCEFAEKTLLRGASGPRARCSPLRQRLGPGRVGGPVGARPRPAHPGSTSCPGRRQIIETDANETPSRERGE